MKSKTGRRDFLHSLLKGGIGLAGAWGVDYAFGQSPAQDQGPGTNKKSAARVVVVGGGWGGLSVIQSLRRHLPDLSITLIEPQSLFWSHPLSNRWLVGLGKKQQLAFPYQEILADQGIALVHDRVEAIDRNQRVVVTQSGRHGYDWLVVCTGIEENFSGWFSGSEALDGKAVQHIRDRFGASYETTGTAGPNRLKARLEGFQGGNWLMTIPLLPYRCPTAPYERACLLAWWMKSRQIKGKLIVVDANTPPVTFSRLVRDTYSDWITYLPQSKIRMLEPYQKRLVTDLETIDFDEAMLMPPQRAGALLASSELTGEDQWAAQGSTDFRSRVDDRIFVIGDAIGRISPLFGFYPKTAEMAVRQGAIVAAQLAAEMRGERNAAVSEVKPELALPTSTCFAIQRVEPLEISRIDTHYRARPDGVIQQTVRQTYFAQAQDEDVAWGNALFTELGLRR